MTRHTALWWIERGLIAVGVVLAIYCAAILVEARFHQTAPLTAAAAHRHPDRASRRQR